MLSTSDGVSFHILKCKRRNEKSICPGVLTCLGNESTPMKTLELARERAKRVMNNRLGHGFRLLYLGHYSHRLEDHLENPYFF